MFDRRIKRVLRFGKGWSANGLQPRCSDAKLKDALKSDVILNHHGSGKRTDFLIHYKGCQEIQDVEATIGIYLLEE